MTRPRNLIAAAVLLTLSIPTLVLAATPRARANTTPSPPDADIPCGIVLVGTTNGIPDALGEFSVVIRDMAREPVEGAHVVVDFNDCTPDIRISAVQSWPGVTVDCADGPVGTVTGITDGNGRVNLRIVGGANNNASGTQAAGFKCATVYADGVNLGQINVGVFDQNGGTGLNPADFAVWFADSFDDDFEGRSDFNCTNTIGPSDLAILIGASFGAGSLQSASSYCH